MLGNVEEVLSHIQPGDRVLDVGGWACPFNRADWVMDAAPYETRGYYARSGLGSKSQGGDKEYFTAETWVQRDICDKEPWPFPDKFFDFSICSHTLEDIRDPLYVCSELIRVSKKGYIEVPSRTFESCRGLEHSNMAGLSHHRWLVEINESHVQFTFKYHIIHAEFQFSLPSKYVKQLSTSETISFIFWEDSFTFAETHLCGLHEIYEDLRQFSSKRYKYPKHRFQVQWLGRQIERGVKGMRRRLKVLKRENHNC